MSFIKNHILYWILPSNILKHFVSIDERAAEAVSKRNYKTIKITWQVAAVGCFCLLLYEYGRNYYFYKDFILFIDSNFFAGLKSILYSNHKYCDLYYFLWNFIFCIIFYLLVPVLTVKLILKHSLRDYGLSFGLLRQHWGIYALFALGLVAMVVVCNVFLVNQLGSGFIDMYPFYKDASRSWFDFIVWELGYMFQFFCLEFFFRGFLLKGLSWRFGHLAVPVVCFPYMMIHFQKLFLESLGSVFFGLILGILALRTRSILGGFFLHVSLALSMDLVAMGMTTGFP